MWFKLILFSMYLCFGSTKDGWPGYSYHDELHGWLKLHRQPTTWRAARISCHMEGAFLASAWTAKFASSLEQLQSGGEQQSQGVVPTIYSGFHTTSAEGAFTFEAGKPAITLDHDGLAALERCVAYFANGTSGDVDCDLLLPYACYVPAPASTPVPKTDAATCPAPAPCPTCAPTTCPTPAPCPTPASYPIEKHLMEIGYEFVNTTGHWYKYHTVAKSWDDANRTCVEEGTHLAIVNSKAEADVFVAFHAKYRNKIVTSPTDCLFVGFRKDSSGVWRTVDGQTIEQAGYHEWYPGYPLETYSQGMFNHDGRIFNGGDSYKLAFICEKY